MDFKSFLTEATGTVFMLCTYDRDINDADEMADSVKVYSSLENAVKGAISFLPDYDIDLTAKQKAELKTSNSIDDFYDRLETMAPATLLEKVDECMQIREVKIQ